MMTYTDGSGNAYVIREDRGKTLEYNPVKPEFSSSGVYDGGTHVKKIISDSQFAQIRSVLRDALKNTANHIENRVKGSGLITIQEPKNYFSCILSPGSLEQREIEKLLKDFLNAA